MGKTEAEKRWRERRDLAMKPKECSYDRKVYRQCGGVHKCQQTVEVGNNLIKHVEAKALLRHSAARDLD